MSKIYITPTKEQIQERLIDCEKQYARHPEQAGWVALIKSYEKQLKYGFIKKRRKP